jgi:hypothetical protein
MTDEAWRTRRLGDVVREVDEWGFPWIHIRLTKKVGPVEHHSLALRDDRWAREGSSS